MHNARRRFAQTVFNAFLFALPRDVRKQHGDEMREDFATRLQGVSVERSAAAMWLFALRSYLDALTSGFSERFAVLGRDLEYAVRGAIHAPLFALTVTLTIGIAVGANAAVDGFISAIVLNPIPMAEPSSIVVAYEVDRRSGQTRGAFTYRDAMTVRSQTRTLDSVAVAADVSGTLLGAGPPQMLHGEAISGDLFSALRVHPQIGRLLTREDEVGGTPIVVLSDAVWRTSFGASPAVIGRLVRIGNSSRRVVGIAPAHMFEPGGRTRGISAGTDYWIPLRDWVWQNAGYQLRVFARVRSGVDRTAVENDLHRIFALLAQREPFYNGVSARALSLKDEIFGNSWIIFWTFGIIVFGVLVVACANVANLFLGRGIARAGEIAVRLALGATRRRIVWQLLTETTLYAVPGGAVGVWVALSISRFFFDSVPAQFAFAREANVNWIALALTFVFIVVALVIAGIGPALALSRPNIADHLKDGNSKSGAREGNGVRSWLVTAEIAVAVAIVTTATLSVRSLDGFLHVPLGITPTGLYVVDNAQPSSARYNTAEKANIYFDRVAAFARSVPGIRAVAWSTTIPTISSPGASFRIIGRSFATGHDPVALVGSVSPDVFATMGIPLVFGRLFDARNGARSAPVVVVNRAFAREYFSSVQAAIGALVVPNVSGYARRDIARTIVGVVGDVRPSLSRAAWPQIYLPLAQMPELDAYLIVATDAAPAVAISAARSAITTVDHEIPTPNVMSLDRAIGASLAGQDTAVFTLTALALIALLLAVAGIYAVVSYDVARRTHEIGIRIALGGRGRWIVLAVLREVSGLAAIGAAVGIVLAVFATKALDGFIVDFLFVNPLTYAAAALVIFASIVTATLLPAMRAAGVQPIVALRYE